MDPSESKSSSPSPRGIPGYDYGVPSVPTTGAPKSTTTQTVSTERLGAHSDAERIAAAERLNAQLLSNRHVIEAPIRDDLDFPVPPVVPTEAFSFYNWKPAAMFANMIGSTATKTALQGLTNKAHSKLSAAIKVLTHLFININDEGDHNRTSLLTAVKDSISSLQAITTAANPRRILRIPGNPTDPGYVSEALRTNLLQKIDLQIELLTQYLGYLEGHCQINGRKEKMACKRDLLLEKRQELILTLLSHDETEAFNDERPLPPGPKGLLAILLHFKNAQQGAVTGLGEAAIDTTAEFATTAIRNGLGLNTTVCTDIDCPKHEITSDGKIVTHHFEEGSGITGWLRKGLRDLNRAPHPRLTAATSALTKLYESVRNEGEHDRAKLLTAVHQSIDTLKALINLHPLAFYEAFQIPSTSTDDRIQAEELKETLSARFNEQIQNLSEYLGYLEGEIKTDGVKHKVPHIRQEQLFECRQKIIQTLLNEKEIHSLKNREELPLDPQGLLALFINIQSSQQGAVNAFLQDVIQTITASATEAALAAIGMPPEVCSKIDLPKNELLADGNHRTNHVEEKISLKRHVKILFDYFKQGLTDDGAADYCSIFENGLKKARVFLIKKQGLNPLEKDSPALKAEKEKKIISDPVLADLLKSIRILETARTQTGTVATIKTALSTVKEIMAHHPIWIGSIANIGLSLPKSGEAISKARESVQKIAAANPTPETDSVYSNDTKELANDIVEIGSYQATYKAIASYFIAKRPDGIKEVDMPSFAIIMKKTYLPTLTQSARKKAFKEAMASYISHSTHVFFLKRWALQLFAPGLILWASTRYIKAFKEGAYRHLEAFIKTAHNPESGELSIEPLYRLKQTFEDLYRSYKGFIGKDKTIPGHTATNWAAALKVFVEEDQVFLENENPKKPISLSNVFTQTSNISVTRFISLAKPSESINNGIKAISKWSSSFKYTGISYLVTFLTSPVIIVAYVIKGATFTLESIYNYFKQNLIRKLLNGTEIFKQIHEQLGNSLYNDTPGRTTTLFMNKLIINLLIKLSDSMDKPATGDLQEFKFSPKCSQALGEAIDSALDFLVLKKEVTGLRKLEKYNAKIAQSEGVSPALEWLLNQAKGIFGDDGTTLNTKAAKATEKLLAECYVRLIQPGFLSQLTALALRNIKEGMLSETAEINSDAAIKKEKQAQLDVDNLLSTVIEKAAELATKPLFKGNDLDKPLKDHAAGVMDLWLGKKADSGIRSGGLIKTWIEKFQSDANLEVYNTILYKQLLENKQIFQNELVQLKADADAGKIGKRSLNAHLSHLHALQEAFEPYETVFLEIHNAKLLAEMRDQPTILGYLNTIRESLNTIKSDLKGANFTPLQDTILNLKTKIRSNSPSISPQLADFIKAAESLAYTKSNSLTELGTTCDQFQAFTAKIPEIEAKIRASCLGTTRIGFRMGQLETYFNALNTEFLSNIPKAEELKELQSRILEAIRNAKSSDIAESETHNIFEALQTRILEINNDFSDEYIREKEKVRSTLAELLLKTSNLTDSLAEPALADLGVVEEKEGDPDPSPILPAKIIVAQKQATAIQALEAIRAAVTNLETMSSIPFSVDGDFPLIRDTQGAVIDLLTERCKLFKKEVLAEREPFMTALTKILVLGFTHSKPPEVLTS